MPGRGRNKQGINSAGPTQGEVQVGTGNSQPSSLVSIRRVVCCVADHTVQAASISLCRAGQEQWVVGIEHAAALQAEPWWLSTVQVTTQHSAIHAHHRCIKRASCPKKQLMNKTYCGVGCELAWGPHSPKRCLRVWRCE